MRKTAAILALALGVTWTLGSANAAKYEFKVSTMFPSTHFILKLAMVPWAKEIEKKTNGQVHFTFYDAGSALGHATKQFDQARAGVVDVSVGIPSIPRGQHPRTVLAELPFAVPNATIGTCALMKVENELKPDFPGTHILYLTVTEPSAAHTTKKITSLDQLKGMRVRTPTPAITAMLNYIGATPVGMPPTQIYESVERGVVDGNIMPWGPVGAFKLYEVLHYHLDARINPVAMYIVMNQRRYDSLPPDIRKVIDDVSNKMFSHWGKWWHDTDQQAIQAAKAHGNVIVPMSDAKRAEWQKRLQPVIATYLEKSSGLPPASAKKIYGDIRQAVSTCK